MSFPPSPASGGPGSRLTLSLGKKKNQTLWKFLDSNSEFVLIPRNPTCHHNPLSRVQLRERSLSLIVGPENENPFYSYFPCLRMYALNRYAQ